MIRAETTPERRALTLLRKHLSDEQKLSLRQTGRIVVRGSSGKKKYTIRASRRGVGVIHPRYRSLTYCCRSYGIKRAQTPWPDKMLAFKLAIENDEPLFLRIINNQSTG